MTTSYGFSYHFFSIPQTITDQCEIVYSGLRGITPPFLTSHALWAFEVALFARLIYDYVLVIYRINEFPADFNYFYDSTN